MKKFQQLHRKDFENKRTESHNADGEECAVFDCLHDTLFVFRSVVVRDNRNDAVIQTENRHKDKAVQFKVHAVHRDRRRRKRAENEVQKIRRNRRDRIEQDRRHADFINLPYHERVGTEARKAELNLRIDFHVEDERQAHAEPLPDNRCERSPRHTHARKGADAEDEQRIEDDIRECARRLRIHRKNRAPRPLQKAVKHDCGKHTERAEHDDVQILHAEIDNFAVSRLACKIRVHAKEADNEKRDKAACGEKESVFGSRIYFVLFFLSETHRKEGIDADRRSDAD